MQRRQARTSQGLKAPASRWDTGQSHPAAALTRRGFVGLLAGLVVAKAAPAPLRRWVTRIDVRFPLNVVGQHPTLHGAEVVLSRADLAAAAKVLADDIDAQAVVRLMPQVLKDRSA